MRLGLHRMSGRADDAFRAYVDRVRPPGVKFLDPGPGDEGLAAWCVARGVQVIGRKFFDPQLLGAAGSRQIMEVVAAARACPSIKYWELHNESWSIPGEMNRYAELSIDFMKAMKSIGRIAVIGCFSEGTPQVDGSDNHEAWRQYLPAVLYAIDDGHVLGLHEYSGPMMQFDTDDPKGSGEGWHTLRYRKSLRILAALGADVSRLKLAFTETGIDDVHPRPGPSNTKGWRDYIGTEWARPPLSPAGDYAGQQLWYCGELTKDPQVLFVVDFGFAPEDEQWTSFDLAAEPAMLQRMGDVMVTLPREHGADTGGGEKVLNGIDVSRWQGVMNWPRAVAAGAQFAYIKASQGVSWVDPQWAMNATMAGRSGMPFGPYHYYECGADPILQARHFAKTCEGVAYQLPPALDLEDTTAPLDEGAFARFVAEVERLMGRPIIYTATWFMAGYVDHDVSFLRQYPLWQAAYSAAAPTCKPWGGWTIWQHSSKGAGAAYGAQSQYIDLNRFKGTMPELLALRIPPVPPVPPTPDIDWTGLAAHAEHEQDLRGVHYNPVSALLRAIEASENPELHVALGETTYTEPSGQERVYAVGESADTRVKWIFVWDAATGKVVSHKVRG